MTAQPWGELMDQVRARTDNSQYQVFSSKKKRHNRGAFFVLLLLSLSKEYQFWLTNSG